MVRSIYQMVVFLVTYTLNLSYSSSVTGVYEIKYDRKLIKYGTDN